MVSFREAVKSASSAAVCSVLAGAEAASYLGAGLVIGGGDTNFADMVRKARRAVCGNTDPDVALPEPPFTGGQCPGVQYTVVGEIRGNARKCATGALTGTNPRVAAFSASPVIGPIQDIFIRQTSGGCGIRDAVVFIVDGNGSTIDPGGGTLSISGGAIDTDTLADLTFTVNVSRVDGQPDTCGDPDAPTIPTYSPTTIIQNITYQDNSSTEVTEEGDFTVNAPVFVAGNIIAPVTVNVGGVKIPVDINLGTGDITFKVGGGDSPTPISDPVPVDNPTEDEPEIEENSLLYGLIVYSARAGAVPDITTSVAQAQAPTLRLPRTGNVWFQIPVGNRVTWIGPLPVQAENVLIPVPNGLGASGYRLVPNTGWQLSAVRVGKPLCGCFSG